ncbi:truncated IS1381 transposase, partial [Streptococcus pneumoniae SP23-BS72]
KERSKVENIFAKVKTFKMFSTTYRNHRKRFGLRMNLIAGIINHELEFWFRRKSNVIFAIQDVSMTIQDLDEKF